MSKSRKEEYEKLRSLINQWNIDHYDIFELSQPNDELEFHGVVRFFFQGGIGASVITKCIRVSSTASTREVIDVLIEKFRPDMRMLNQNKYALYEVHVNGEERRLADDEKPLFVQLNWGNDVREGRFLLRNEDHPTVRDPALGFDKSVLQQDQGGFKRRLSKREKKELKRREKERGKEAVNGDESVANKLYEDAPETSFTRSISNPEAVMRRRRQQKLEKKLAQMSAADGANNDSGGTLKIYGESLRPDVPYKTLFLSTADTAAAVVKEALEKYGLEKEDPASYCLLEVFLPPGGMEYHGESSGNERVLDDNECPLAIVIQQSQSRNQGHIIFQLHRRSADYAKRRQKPRSMSHEDLRANASDQRHTNVDMLPYLTEMNVRGKPKRHVLPLNVTEVVNVTEVANNKAEYNGKHFLQLSGSDIHPRHCVIAHTQGVVTVTPNSQDAETYVEGQRIYETTMLKHGMTVQFAKDKLYRFLEPRFQEPQGQNRPYQLPVKTQRVQPHETNFDVDGNIETISGSSPRSGSHSWDMQQRSASDRSPGSSLGSHGPEDPLPASVEYILTAEDRLLRASVLEVKSKQLQFKLAPAYTLYMSVRHLLSARSPVTQRGQLVTDLVNKTSKLIQQTIQEHHNDPSDLAFWMANSSELLHMFKQDRDIHPLSGTAQEILAEAVQTAFHHLVRCLQGDLQRVMPAFLDPSDAADGDDEAGHGYNMGRPTLADVLNTLSAAMTLLRRCRVNAALTIQLFSQLFHFINTWLFNMLVTGPQLQLCARVWGLRLKRRLASVETWAEKQGLELAADCHLCRIIQAAHLLQAPKSSANDITNISSTCFKLNSLQLRALLTHYMPEKSEPSVSPAFVERVVAMAENMTDAPTRADGREVRLEEDSDLHLPFLLPEDGYSCDTIRGIPNGLPEFVKQMENAGICRFILNNSSSGSWTVYMEDELSPSETGSPGFGLPSAPEIFTISFKKVKGSMGLSIVAAIGEGQPEQGIYIKSVVDGGAAAMDGRLQAGDQLLEVDGRSLVGVSQDKAAELMTKTGQVVKLKVAKRAVLYHNLGSLLNQPSPTSQRAVNSKAPGPIRAFSDEGPPPPYEGKDLKPAGSYGNPDRMRAPSSGNIADTRPGMSRDAQTFHRDNDPRSKSTTNLHVEANVNSGVTRPSMKAAQSVGVLNSNVNRRQDSRPGDYENQSGFQQAASRQQNPQGRPQNLQPVQGYQQPQRTSDRSSVSSRASSSSSKDMKPQSAYYSPEKERPQSAYYSPEKERPQSAYYSPEKERPQSTYYSPDRESQDFSRPRSEDVGSKLKEWQDKYEDPRGKQSKNSAGGYSPPSSSTSSQSREPPPQPTHNPPPKPTAHERLFSQPGVPQKVNNTAYSRQPNFYDHTTPLQRELPPAFHQLQRPPSEGELRPRLAPKPVAMPSKKNQLRVQHTDMPSMKVDNRETQPHFFGNTRPSPSPQTGQLSSPHVVQQPGFPQLDQKNAQYGQKNAPYEQKNSLYDQRNTPYEQENASYDQRNTPYDQKNTSYDQRNTPYDQRNTPYEQRNTSQQQEQRSQVQPDSRNDTRFAQDLRMAHDPRNGPAYEQRGLQHDQWTGPDLRNVPDPRNTQQPNIRDGYQQQKNAQNMANTQPSSAFQERSRTVQQDPYFPGNSSGYNYNTHAHDLPPPPSQKNVSPEIPAPHTEDLPPVPPPPSHEALIEQKLLEEQQKLMQQISATNHFLASDPSRDRKYSPSTTQQQQPVHQTQQYQPLPQQQQQQQQQRYQPQQKHQQSSINRVLPPGIDARDTTPLGFQVAQDGYRANDSFSQPNYQNIGFAAEARSSSGPGPQLTATPLPSTDYYSYSNPALKTQAFQVKPAVPPTKPKLQDRGEANSRSAWDRDAKEKAREEEHEELYRAREQEIADLESRPYLSPQDKDRLRKLKMEHEFQRRVKEVEKGDDNENDDEPAERLHNRERMIQTLREDLEKSRQRMREFELSHQRADASREEDRLRTLERRLEMYEKEREEQKQRIQKKQDNRAREQQDWLQRDTERMYELQSRYDDENKGRAEIHKDSDESRSNFVRDEKYQTGFSGTRPGQTSQGYPQYANVSSQGSFDGTGLAPPPPERKSSYETFTHHQQRASFRNSSNIDLPPPPAAAGGSSGGLPSALKTAQEQPPPTKKSVSFNTQMNSYKDRTPSHSISSYRSPTGSLSSEHEFPPPPNFSPDVEVFESDVHPLHGSNSTDIRRSDFTYNSSSHAPNVIGTQEVYRDPRSQIEAKIASQSSGRGADRMSFRDKMKYFATEAGEDTIKLKPKSSKTLRNIESQLNGQ